MRTTLVANTFLTLTLGLSASVTAAPVADTIYSGGPIITIDDTVPRAEAVAVGNGRILAVGTLEDMKALRGDATNDFDLAGGTMLPGFVDSHGHVVFGGLQALSANLLAPPDGNVTDIASLQAALDTWRKRNADSVKKLNLIVGFGYDNAQLKEVRHPTRADLDAVSADTPIVIVHQSGHIGVANSAALAMADIDADTENPAGGVIQRNDDGTPNGVLEEYAFFPVLMKSLASLGPDGMQEFTRAGSRMWASFGYTTGQDGRATGPAGEAVKAVAASEGLPIDIVSFPDVLEAQDYIAANASQEYVNRFRVGGCKLTIDGSPQGFTALRDRPYYAPVGNYPPGYKGYSAITAEQADKAIDWCFSQGLQVIVHSNGEGASDILLNAIEKAQAKHADVDNRPVLVHGQFLREDQVDRAKALGVFPSLFPMHTFYWGDWHAAHTVGPVAAQNISPTGWLVERDMIFGTHHDAPVALPDSMRVLSATVTRRTRSGKILGPDQRVDVLTALKAMTIWPAWQHFEEDEKGSITVGKKADFVVLSADPTAVDPLTIADINVLKTIKADAVVYDQQTDAATAALGDRVPTFGGTPHGAHHVLDVVYEALAAREKR